MLWITIRCNRKRIELEPLVAFHLLKSRSFWVFASAIMFRGSQLLWDSEKSMAERWQCCFMPRQYKLVCADDNLTLTTKQLWFCSIFPSISCETWLQTARMKQRGYSHCVFYFLLKLIWFNRWITFQKSEMIMYREVRFPFLKEHLLNTFSMPRQKESHSGSEI